MVDYALTGGLDLTTVKPLIKPGTLRECLNYEVSTVDGYTRIGGIERFDGSQDVGGYKIWRLKYTTGDAFVAGDPAWFDEDWKGWVLEVAMLSGINVVYILMPGSAPNPALPENLVNDTKTAEVLSRDAIFEGHGTQENFDAGLEIITDVQRAAIGIVPGRAGSDIIGGFGYKDRVYAIRDLSRIAFQDGYYTDADEGKWVELPDGLFYLILDVRITGDQAGILTYALPGSVAPTGPVAAPIGPAILVELPVTGDLGDGYTFIPYDDALTASGGVPPYVWTVVGEGGEQITPIDSPDASAINFIPQVTNAALWRSSLNGWENVPLGREMAFSNGTSFLENYSKITMQSGGGALDTGAEFPTDGEVNGVATTDMDADDGNSAPLASDATEFKTFAFDMSAIPDNADITGIEVVIERQSDTANQAQDGVVDLLNIPGGTDNRAAGGAWPNVAATKSYGGPSDLWGSQAITPALLKDPDFGVRVISQRVVPATAHIGGINYMTVKVYFNQKDAPIYIWDGTTDVPATLHNTQFLAGDTSDNDAAGYMSITAATNAAKPRLVNVGDQIRNAPAGAGDVLAIVAGRDRPVFLAGQAELDNNRARYQFVVTNFYGRDEYEAVYGVCGASPAFAFDGFRLIRIRTQLPATLDLPRHITRHGDMLVLGFFPGASVFSQPGNPFEMRGEQGASAIEFGDRMVNMLPFAGDALGVICQSSTFVLRGLVPESFAKLPVSTKRGGIEYTAADMGRVVLCDGLGIFGADSPESFGAAERNYLSTKVHPLLTPRLQAKANTDIAFLRPIAALPVRAKNQMRLYFWDGWVLTMTLTEPAQFTTQRYFEPAPDIHTSPTPWAVRALVSYIESSGRERLFCSFYGGIKEGYLFEMDAGRSFDGAPVPAYIVANSTIVGAASQDKRFDRVFVYGAGFGAARVTYSHLREDQDTFAGDYPFTMGKLTRIAKLVPTAFRGVADSPMEGFDISMRYDSNTHTEGPHSLQYVELYVDDRGKSRGRP